MPPCVKQTVLASLPVYGVPTLGKDQTRGKMQLFTPEDQESAWLKSLQHVLADAAEIPESRVVPLSH